MTCYLLWLLPFRLLSILQIELCFSSFINLGIQLLLALHGVRVFVG